MSKYDKGDVCLCLCVRAGSKGQTLYLQYVQKSVINCPLVHGVPRLHPKTAGIGSSTMRNPSVD